jgi:CHAP domain-containing protein
MRAALRLLPLFCLTLFCLTLAACGSRGNRHAGDTGVRASVECAPFARALTGVTLSGAAADWWWQAAGRYARSNHPETGSLLVFRASGRLPSGHVAVVSKVLTRRQILVTQANWLHHHVTEDQPVVDVSEDGDWSQVRVWWPPTGQMGSAAYGTFGFIRPDHPAGHDRLAEAVPAAIQSAQQAW